MFHKDNQFQAVKRLPSILKIKYMIFFFFFINLSTNVFEVVYLDVYCRDIMGNLVTGKADIVYFQAETFMAYNLILQAYQIKSGFYDAYLTQTQLNNKMSNSTEGIQSAFNATHDLLLNSNVREMYYNIENNLENTAITYYNDVDYQLLKENQNINRLIYTLYDIQPHISNLTLTDMSMIFMRYNLIRVINTNILTVKENINSHYESIYSSINTLNYSFLGFRAFVLLIAWCYVFYKVRIVIRSFDLIMNAFSFIQESSIVTSRQYFKNLIIFYQQARTLDTQN